MKGWGRCRYADETVSMDDPFKHNCPFFSAEGGLPLLRLAFSFGDFCCGLGFDEGEKIRLNKLSVGWFVIHGNLNAIGRQSLIFREGADAKDIGIIPDGPSHVQRL